MNNSKNIDRLLRSVTWFGGCAAFWSPIHPEYTHQEAVDAVRAFVAGTGKKVVRVTSDRDAWNAQYPGISRFDVYFSND